MFKYGIISLHSNPLHFGHCEYARAASKLCDKVICIVNNDDQIRLRGNVPVMPEEHRVAIMKDIRWIDDVTLAIDEDSSVCKTLRLIHGKSLGAQLVFFNSGDRSPDNQDSRESEVCKELGISEVYIPLPKIWSSSEVRKRMRDDIV
jgi:cytidyltransferase-like protein